MMYVEYIQKEWDCTDEVYSPFFLLQLKLIDTRYNNYGTIIIYSIHRKCLPFITKENTG